MNRKSDTKDRAAKIAAIRAQHQRQERRRNLLIMAVAGVVVLALVAVTAVVLIGEQRRQAALVAEQERLEELADQPIEGVEEFGEQSRNHVDGPVAYEQEPPVGGDHLGTDWSTCGVYTEPLQNELAVHSLEHGAVWITYRPDLPADQVSILSDLASINDYVLVSPYEGLESPVVASAWGLQLQLDSADDERLAQFVVKYQQGEQTPEPGAAC